MDLNPSEQTIKRFYKHWMYIAWPFLGMLFFSNRDLDGVVGACGLWFIYRILRTITDKFVVTNEKIYFQTGIFSRKYIDLPISKINHVEFSQSIFGRLLDYGDISLSSAAALEAIKYSFVSRPKEFKEIVNTTIQGNK